MKLLDVQVDWLLIDSSGGGRAKCQLGLARLVEAGLWMGHLSIAKHMSASFRASKTVLPVFFSHCLISFNWGFLFLSFLLESLAWNSWKSSARPWKVTGKIDGLAYTWVAWNSLSIFLFMHWNPSSCPLANLIGLFLWLSFWSAWSAPLCPFFPL